MANKIIRSFFLVLFVFQFLVSASQISVLAVNTDAAKNFKGYQGKGVTIKYYSTNFNDGDNEIREATLSDNVFGDSLLLVEASNDMYEGDSAGELWVDFLNPNSDTGVYLSNSLAKLKGIDLFDEAFKDKPYGITDAQISQVRAFLLDGTLPGGISPDFYSDLLNQLGVDSDTGNLGVIESVKDQNAIDQLNSGMPDWAKAIMTSGGKVSSLTVHFNNTDGEWDHDAVAYYQIS